MQISKTELKIFQNEKFLFLRNFLSSYTQRVYFVGGFCRDYFLQKECYDIDIEIYDIDEKKFEFIMQKLGANGVGKSFFVYKFENFDLSLPRIENKNGIGHKGFEVFLCNDEKIASKRRDFSINSIMINIFTLEILDFNDGILDIKNKTLKMICKQSFIEDSLRVLRGVQFASRFGFSIEKQTFLTMQSMELNDLSKDRISAELVKFFNSKNLFIGLELIYRLGIFEFLFLKKLSECEFLYLFDFFKKTQNFIKNEMFFLYIISNVLGINKDSLLKRLNLSFKFKRLKSEPFLKEISKEEMMQIALKIPLKNWLGLYDENRVKMAKKLGIYDKKFSPKIDTQSIINQGFKNEEISQEINRIQQKAIKEHLALFDF